MRRPGFWGFILLAILSHHMAALQNPPAPPAQRDSLYIVVLKEPSLLERVVQWNREASFDARRGLLRSAEARDYQRQLRAEQRRVIRSVLRPQQVLDQRTFLLNMLLVRASPGEVDDLRAREEVEAVYPNEERYPMLDSAPFVIGAPTAWEAVGGNAEAGRGIKIGIIDSGIEHNHPMLNDSGLQAPPGYPLGDLAFTSNKVIVSRTYVLPKYGLRQQEDTTPADEAGHGTGVASIAAGRWVETDRGPIQGMAPVAFIGNYKVFGSPSVNPVTTVSAVLAAMEDAVQDGMDVINLSLGGPSRDPELDPEQMAIRNAVEAGIVVVAAAGNGGPDPASISSPATSAATLAVGATNNGRIFASSLEVTAEASLPLELRRIAYVPGTGSEISEAVGPLPLTPVAAFETSGTACTALPRDSLLGQAALVKRGECFFSDKARHVFTAGAEAMVVYNDVSGPPPVMGGLEEFAQAAVMIEREPGEGLQDLSLAGISIQVTIRAASELFPFATEANEVTAFSGRGPNIDSSIKPDLTAPGRDIYAASHQLTPEPQYSLGNSGSSFAAPLVSGAAALIRQLHPEWSELLTAADLAKAIKSVLVNTAVKDLVWAGRQAGTIHTGAGRLDLSRAVHADSMLDPVSLSFGTIDEDASTHAERIIKITNLASQSQDFEVAHVESVSNATVDLSAAPGTLSLAPGETGEIRVTAHLQAPLTGGVFEGFIQITGSAGGTPLEAPFWGGITVENPSITLRVSPAEETQYASISAALEAAQPGNVIEVADSSTYREIVEVRYNPQGLKLHGLTIRGRPGESPTLDASGLTSRSAAITVRDLQRVTIEGLRIEGGSAGLRFGDSSGVIRDNLIRGALDTASYGIDLSNSSVHVFGNTLQNNGGGIRASASSSLLQFNQIGGEEGEGNQGRGIFVSRGNAGIFDNRILNNTGSSSSEGIRIASASAVIKGNVIRGTEAGTPAGVSGHMAELLLLDNRIEANQGAGVFLQSQSQARIQRNLVLHNRDAGISIEEGSQAEIYWSRILENGSGIHALSSNLQISDSLIAGSKSGDGLFAALGMVEGSNNTISFNQGFGINIAGAETNVSNSILSNNQAGDVSGLNDSALEANLIGDGAFNGMNENFAASPMFTDPAAFDFSLQPVSPAIDQGNNLLSLSSLDLFSHQRSVDGDGDGIARVDLGAIEFDSSTWKRKILPVLSTAGAEWRGLAIVNAFNESAEFFLRTYDLEGLPADTYGPEALPPLSQISLLVGEVFSTSAIGWVEILSTQPDLTAFTLVGANNLRFMDGAEVSAASASALLFPEVRNTSTEKTRLHIVNPNESGELLVLEWVRPGQPVQLRNFSMRAGEMRPFDLGDTFGSGSGGYVKARFESGDSLHGIQIFGTPESQAALLGLNPSQAAAELWAAHFVSGSEMETRVTVINAGPSVALNVALEVLDEDGGLLHSSVVGDLLAGGQLQRKIGEILPSDASGWLRIRSEGGSLVGTAILESPSGRFLSALPLQAEGAREFIFGHVAHSSGIYSGLALLNPTLEEALVSVEVFNPNGERAGVSLAHLASGVRTARMITEWAPQIGEQVGGFVRVRSNVPLCGFEAFGAYSLEFLSTVPAQVIIGADP